MQSSAGEDKVWPDLAAGAAQSGGTPTSGMPDWHRPALYWGVSCAIHLLSLVALGLLTWDFVDVPMAPPMRVSVLPTMANGEEHLVPQPLMPEDRDLDSASLPPVSPSPLDPVPTATLQPRVLQTSPARELPKRGRPPTIFGDAVPPLIPPVGPGNQEAPAATTPGTPIKEQSKPQVSPSLSIGARYAQNPTPPYPSEARRRGWEGTVLLMVEIRENGRPERITIKESSGHSVLDNAALGAVGRWTFVPAQQNGKPVRSVAEVPIIFSLQERR